MFHEFDIEARGRRLGTIFSPAILTSRRRADLPAHADRIGDGRRRMPQQDRRDARLLRCELQAPAGCQIDGGHRLDEDHVQRRAAHSFQTGPERVDEGARAHDNQILWHVVCGHGVF